MKDIVIIKLYRPAYASTAFHDYVMQELPQRLQDLKQYANQIGKNIFFTICTNDGMRNECFTHITHSSDLNPLEKQKYIDLVRVFAKDAEIINGTLNKYDLPLKIVLVKTAIELIEL